MKKAFAIFLVSSIVGMASCSKNSADEATNSPVENPIHDLVRSAFTVAPFDATDITALVPLGNLNPPGHVFPTDHMYFYCFTDKPSLEIKSPGNVTVVRIGKTHYNAGLPNDHYDYTIYFGSDKSYLWWGHVSNLSPRLLTLVNNFNLATCETPYSIGNSTYQQCFLNVSIAASSGETIGISNTFNGLAGMDFGAFVNGSGTNPLEYFDEHSRTMLETKLGRFDGKVKRTAMPICGEIIQDVTATALGNWIKPGLQNHTEEFNIALVKDNIDPSIQAISTGNSIPGLPSNVYYFVPQSSGFTNRHFVDVKADGNTYCYTLGILNFPFPGNSLIPSTSVIIKMENGSTLSVEKRNCDCSCAPYNFTSNKVIFTR